MATGFGAWQPEWAALGIPTFPVQIDAEGRKRPAIRGWGRVGLRGSEGLAQRFADAPGIAFAAERAGITVIDIDEPGEEPLADAVARFGDTPAIARTASGRHHLYYARTDEGRRIRPWGPEIRIDVIGRGVVVAPPTRASAGSYCWARGGLHALDDLPHALEADQLKDVDETEAATAVVGNRNSYLWRRAMQEAPFHDDLGDLIESVREWNRNETEVPLEDWEVRRIAEGAWDYEARGENWIASGRGLAAADEAVAALALRGPDGWAALALYTALRAQWSGRSRFAVANAMAPSLNMPLRRFQAARALLVEVGALVEVRRAGRGSPAVYRFGGPTGPKG